MPPTLPIERLADDPAVAPVVDRFGDTIRGPDRMYYPENVQLDRGDTPMPTVGNAHPADPVRDSDFYKEGKPFDYPGHAVAFTLSIQEWEDPMPLGFARKVPYALGAAYPPGKMQPTGQRVNIETPPAVAFGSLVGTTPGSPLLTGPIPGQL